MKRDLKDADLSDVYVLQRCLRSVALYFLLAGFIAFLGFWLSRQTNAFDASISIANVEVSLPLFFLLFLVTIVRPLFLLRDMRCEISEHHLRCVTGLLSFRRRDTVIPFEELKGARAEQNLFQRLLGYGRVLAWTHSASAAEIRLAGVKHPRKVVTLISSRIDQAILRRESSPSGSKGTRHST